MKKQNRRLIEMGVKSQVCVCVCSPACLWWVGVFGSCVLLPCWRKRAAPLTMKKLSLRLETTTTLFCCSFFKYFHRLVGEVMQMSSFSII